VLAFEPIPSIYAVLCENLRLNSIDWVKAECLAASDGEGRLRMWFEAGNLLSFTSRLSEKDNLIVPVTSIDRYVESAGLSKLDFVKIDVEGAEDAVVRGMTTTLQRFRPVILVEIHGNDGKESEGLQQLKAMGYKLMRVERVGLTPWDTQARGGHLVGVNMA